MKKLSAAAVFTAILLLITSCNVIINTPTTTDGQVTETEPVETYAHSDMVEAPLDEIIATTKLQSIPVSTFKYFFMDNYNSFLNQYYYYLSYYGLDLNIPLHDQEYSAEENTSWYQVFLDNGKSAFEQYAKFAEKALEEGMSLDEADNAEIEAYLVTIDQAAESSGSTFDEYMADYMGEGMTREMIKKAIELSQLGYKYYLKLNESITFTDAEIDAEYKNGAGKYSLVDYNEVKIEALYDETDGEEEIAAAKEAAKSTAELVKKYIEEDGMTFAEAYAKATESTVQDAPASTDTETGDSEEEQENASVKNYLTVGAPYDSSEKYAFIYKDGAAAGQVEISYDDNGDATVIQVVKLPYKNTKKTVNVRHILLTSNTYSSEEEAEAKAKELLEKINSSEDKISTVVSLAAEFSEDPGSSTNGGIYENVKPGDMVTEFNDWCFDSERKAGDTDIVRTSFGYHVMYLDGFGDELWHYLCESSMRETKFAELAENVYSEITVTYNEDLLDRIVK